PRSPQRAPVLALVVGAVLPGADRLPPPGVLLIPGHRLAQALAERHARGPAKRANLLGGERVAAVVTRPVGHVLDLRGIGAGELDDLAHHREVGLLVGAARVVHLAWGTVFEHVADRTREVA